MKKWPGKVWGFIVVVLGSIGVIPLVWTVAALAWVYKHEGCSLGLAKLVSSTWWSECSESLIKDLSDNTMLILLLVSLAVITFLHEFFSARERKQDRKEREKDRKERDRQHKELLDAISSLGRGRPSPRGPRPFRHGR